MLRVLNTVRRMGTLLLGAVLVVGSGCAALTVDVDMYKGPLSNNEILQARQINATVIGAKPVLLGLRNHLERGEDPVQHERDWLATQTKRERWRHDERSRRMKDASGSGAQNEESRRVEGVSGGGAADERSRRMMAVSGAEKEAWQAYDRRQRMFARYASRFWPPPPPDEPNGPWLGDGRAIRVNAVLGLYLDDASEEPCPYVSQIQTYMDRVKRAQSVLEPSRQHAALWQQVNARFFPDPNALCRHPAVAYLEGQIKSLSEKVHAAQVRQAALGEDKRDEIAELGRQIEDLNHQKQQWQRKDEDLRDAYDTLRRGYQGLLDPLTMNRTERWIGGIEQGHAKVYAVYARDPSLSKTIPFLKEDMPRDANAQFQKLRDPNFVRAHFQFLSGNKPADANEQKAIEAVNEIATCFLDAQRALEQTLRLTLDLIEYLNVNRDKSVSGRWYLEATVRFALSLVKCTALAAAMANEKVPPAVNELQRRMVAASGGDFTLALEKWEDPTIRRWKDVLYLLFEEDPHATSSQMRAAHLSLMSGDYHVPEKDIYSRYNEPSKRMFGLTLASTERRMGADWVEETRRDIEDAPRSWARWNEYTTGAGLEHGRLAQGLETLIDKYLELAASLPSSGPQGDEQQKQLMDARSKLMDALVDFAEKILVIANYDTLLRGPTKNGDREKAQKIRRYTDVLQSVGNSIIVQANELRTKAAHDDSLLMAGKREKLAVEHAFSVAGDDSSDSDEEPCALPEGLFDTCGNCKQVLDNLITALRYEHAALLRKPAGQNSNDANNVARALAVLYEQRADMVYLRPSSAYLRSSYPAASLQSDPSSTVSRNMLLDHLTQPRPRDEELQTLWDIDKQFWQNVNRIRVVGTGKTNYVVVKDDIGNWYVKGYGNDPNCIIQGARSAALFAGMNAGALSAVEKVAGTSNKTGPQPAQQEPAKSAQIKQLDGLERAYDQRLKSDFQQIKAGVKNLSGSIKSRWDADALTRQDANDLRDKALNGPTATLTKACADLAGGGDPNRSEADRLVEAMKAVKKFGADVDAGIAGITLKRRSAGTETTLTEEQAAGVKKAARKHVRTVVGNFLLPWVERRSTAVRDYEMVLLVLGNSGPEPGR